MGAQDLSVSFVREDEALRVIISGELDFANAHTVKEAIQDMVDDGLKMFVIDLEGCSYIDSEGVRVLLWMEMLLRSREGRIRIERCSSTVLRVLDILGLQSHYGLDK